MEKLPKNSQTTYRIYSYPRVSPFPSGASSTSSGLSLRCTKQETSSKKKKLICRFSQQITFLFILSSIANSAWIFLWHYEYVGLSVTHDDHPSLFSPRNLCSSEHRKINRYDERKTLRPCPLQRLSWLDHGCNHRKCHRVPCFSAMGWFWDRPVNMDDHYHRGRNTPYLFLCLLYGKTLRLALLFSGHSLASG